MHDNAMLRETLWVEKKMPEWERLGHVPQRDLERYCSQYVPAMIRNTTGDIIRVQIILYYQGRTGVDWIHELLDWDVGGRPPDEQVTLLLDMAAREACRVAAKTRVQRLYFDMQLKNMHES